jgi:hypothetical protein
VFSCLTNHVTDDHVRGRSTGGAMPRHGGECVLLNLAYGNFRIAHPLKLNGPQTRISN